MRVFLTGGTGLVGRALAGALAARGDGLVCVTRGPEQARGALPADCEIIAGDPALPGPWQERVAGCDAVVNLAGQPIAAGRWTARRKRRIRRSRLETTRNVAEAVAAAERTRVLVSASATGYYGHAGGERALDEACEPGHDFLGRLVIEWEASTLAAQRRGKRVVLARLGIVLAREGGALPRLLLPFRLGLGGPLGSGRQYLPWIHLADVVRALIFALDCEELAGPANVVAPDPPTQAAFARALGRTLGRPAAVRTPAFLLRLALGELAEALLGGQRAVPKALRARGFTFTHEKLEAALAELLAT